MVAKSTLCSCNLTFSLSVALNMSCFTDQVTTCNLTMAPTSCDKCRSLKVKCTKVEVQSACSKFVTLPSKPSQLTQDTLLNFSQMLEVRISLRDYAEASGAEATSP